MNWKMIKTSRYHSRGFDTDSQKGAADFPPLCLFAYLLICFYAKHAVPELLRLGELKAPWRGGVENTGRRVREAVQEKY